MNEDATLTQTIRGWLTAEPDAPLLFPFISLLDSCFVRDLVVLAS